MSRARVRYIGPILLATWAAGCMVSGVPVSWADASVVTEDNQPVRLTHAHPIATLPIPHAVLQPPPSLLILPITHIANESLTPIAVHASLSWSEPQGGDPPRIVLGQISVFPADRPATFTIRLPPEFHELLQQSPDFHQRDPTLVLELRPVHERALPPMELTLGSVEWRR